MWIISAAVAALVLAGVVYVVFRSDTPGTQPVPITGAERAEEARGVIAEIEQARARAAGEVERQPSAAQSAGGAGAVVPAPRPDEPSGASDLDVAFDQAQAFQRDGQLADAQLLYFYGARAGHGPSAFALGTMNDPNHHSPETSLLPEPDAFQAYRWYSAAREQGYAGAAERLDALHEWAVAASESGDIEAEQLLLQWE
jgi:TPR repeat protein